MVITEENVKPPVKDRKSLGEDQIVNELFKYGDNAMNKQLHQMNRKQQR